MTGECSWQMRRSRREGLTTMMSSKSCLASAALVLTIATPSMAGTIYDLNATATIVAVSNFTIEFNDQNNDAMLSSTTEITSFSGASLFGFSVTSVPLVPDLSGFTNGGNDGEWGFSGPPFGESGIAAGRANDEFDIIRLSVSYRLKCIPERSDARRQR